MPKQPNYCTHCKKLMPDTEAAYYCSKSCMERVLQPWKFDAKGKRKQ